MTGPSVNRHAYCANEGPGVILLKAVVRSLWCTIFRQMRQSSLQSMLPAK